MLNRWLIKKVSPKRTIGFWLWAALAYFLALILLMLLVKIAFSGKALTEYAFENGQRVVINLSNGEMEGKPRHNPLQAIQDKNGDGMGAPLNPGINKDGLASVPLPALTEQTDKGILPVTSHDGTMPWKYYARPYNPAAKHPMVAVVFTNLGLSKTLTEQTLTLPHDLTLSFSPYANDTGKWAVKARAEGFESLIDLPVQAENYPFSDPGPYGLMEDTSIEENIARIHGVLGQYPGFVGVLASADEKMTANKDEIRPYLLELKKRGLLFLYIKTVKNSAMDEFAKSNTFYILGIDKIIDEEITRSAIEMQLQALTDLAKKNGYAIGLVHSYPPTLEALQSWTQGLKEQGVDLAPVSAIGRQVFP